MRKMLGAMAVVALMLTTGAAADDACVTRDDALPVEGAGATYYVWNDACQPGCLFSVWIIEESNGVAGLQLASDNEGRHCDPDAATL